VLTQILLTLSVFIVLSVRKAKAVKSNSVDLTRRALHSDAWPDDVLTVSNNIQNQFQTPVLFYVLALAFLSTNAVSGTILALSWVYAISRLVHASIHIGSNYVPMRLRAFIVGIAALIALTVMLGIQLIYS